MPIQLLFYFFDIFFLRSEDRAFLRLRKPKWPVPMQWLRIRRRDLLAGSRGRSPMRSKVAGYPAALLRIRTRYLPIVNNFARVTCGR